jgi:hypothetical protein
LLLARKLSFGHLNTLLPSTVGIEFDEAWKIRKTGVKALAAASKSVPTSMSAEASATYNTEVENSKRTEIICPAQAVRFSRMTHVVAIAYRGSRLKSCGRSAVRKALSVDFSTVHDGQTAEQIGKMGASEWARA